MINFCSSRILSGLLLSTALVLATPGLADTANATKPAAAVIAKKINGHLLYNRLFEILREYDIGLIDPAVRAKWVTTWQHQYDKAPLDTEDSADQACLSMVLSLHEPHDYYFKPDKTKAEKAEMKSDFGGIGAPVEIKNAQDAFKGLSKTSTQAEIIAAMVSSRTVSADHPFVVADDPEADTPAAKAGMRKGDVLLTVDGKSLNGMTNNEIVDKIHGKIGTKVKLTVQQTAADGTTSTKEVTLVRATVVLHAVHVKDEGDGITYTKVDNFESKYLLPDWKKATEKAAKGQGFILDLRDDPGGILQYAEPLAASMLKQGTLVELHRRGGNLLIVHRTDLTPEAVMDVFYNTAKPDDKRITVNTKRPKLAIPEDMPIVVLINGGSASASELTAGALQANKRATLEGTESRAKGVGQGMFPLLYDRSTHVTNFEFLPGGVPNDRVGIIPDKPVEQGADDVIWNGDPAHDTQLRAAIATVKELLARQAEIAQAKAAHAKVYDAETDTTIGDMKDSLAKGQMPY
jgi:C-terminal peptidase prc